MAGQGSPLFRRLGIAPVSVSGEQQAGASFFG